MEENNLRTDLLLIINEYVLLDVDGKVTSTKEWINEMLDKIVGRVEKPVKPATYGIKKIGKEIGDVYRMLSEEMNRHPNGKTRSTLFNILAKLDDVCRENKLSV